MLKTKRMKIVAALAGALCTFGGVAAIAIAAGSEDKWAAGANQAWAASSTKTTFVSSVITVTCKTNTAGGTSVGSGPDIGALAMTAPKFSSCTDSLGGTDTVKTVTSGWTVSFISDKGNAKCPAGTGKDETSGKDCVVLAVPKSAATIVLGSLGCTLTVQPAAASAVGATASDPGGTKKDTFTLASQALTFSGCGTSGSAAFSGTYTLSKPNAGVLVDNS